MSSGEGGGEDENNEQMRRWREIYGDMIPERIVDTKIGEDGKRYYKVQWAASSFEPAKNFLEAEMLIRKYWDPVEKKLKLPSNKKEKNSFENAASTSSSGQVDNSSVDTELKVGECSTSKENLETNSDEKLSAGKESVTTMKDKPTDESKTSENDNLQENNLQENEPSDKDENKIKKTLSTTDDRGKRKLIDTKDIGSGENDSDDKINESKKPRT